jgi:hypothetical protein
MFRRSAMVDYKWNAVVGMEKQLIIHLLLKGPVVDVPSMSYTNYLSFKDSEEVARLYLVNETVTTDVGPIARAVLAELREHLPSYQFPVAALAYLRHIRWPRLIAKSMIRRLHLAPR